MSALKTHTCLTDWADYSAGTAVMGIVCKVSANVTTAIFRTVDKRNLAVVDLAIRATEENDQSEDYPSHDLLNVPQRTKIPTSKSLMESTTWHS